MDIKTLSLSSPLPFQNPKKRIFSPIHHFSFSPSRSSFFLSILRLSATNPRIRTYCLSPVEQNLEVEPTSVVRNVGEDGIVLTSFSSRLKEEDEAEAIEVVPSEAEAFANKDSIWEQMKEIILFAGPAVGLWTCGPLMSLIDTAVIGQGSSIELAALGPGTVVCDYASYVFMFLSIATSNMVATSIASQDKNEVQHRISILLFVGFTCGVGMLVLTKFLGAQILAAFTGSQNLHLVPAANTYVQIRGLAWPAILVGWVAQSASLGLKDSWGPLKALAVAGAVNAIGDIVLCCFLGYGIAGAAWATMVSQIIAGFMMIEALNGKGFNAYSVSVPSPNELLQIFELAAPVFITMIAKVAFYSLLTYFATSMGTNVIAAHQVMVQVFCMCTVWGEPLSQTAQSFMPEMIYFSKDPQAAPFHGVAVINNQSWCANKLGPLCWGQAGPPCLYWGPHSGADGPQDAAGVAGIAAVPTAQCHGFVVVNSQSGGANKARMLLKSLVIMGAITGLVLGVVGTSVPWLFPNLFTSDHEVVGQMHKVLLPYFLALAVTPPTHCLEGTLLAGRDLNFLSLSMSGCFSFCALLVMLLSSRGIGLAGCYWGLVGFQWTRFSIALMRLSSPTGLLYSEEFSRRQIEKLKIA